jgi:hypothetical protein
MDFKRVRTFVTVAEHGTRSRILHDQVTQIVRPKSRKTHSPHHQPAGVFDASIPCDLKVYTQKLLPGGYPGNSFIRSRAPKTTGSVGYFPRPIACEFHLGKAPSFLHR